MKNIGYWLNGLLLSAALAGFVHGQQTTNESQPTQDPARSSSSTGETARNNQPAIDSARLAERDRLGSQAMQLRAEGKLAEAIAKWEEMLAMERSLFGNDHEEVVVSLQGIATWREEAGDFGAAKLALQEVLEIRIKRFGEDHWQVTDARLAVEDADLRSKLTPDQRRRLTKADEGKRKMVELYQQGKFAEAILWAAKALEIHKVHLGENHPGTAVSLDNLAALYLWQGDYARALPLSEQALAIRKQALGENHPDTATSLNNLAWLYQSQGDYARALPLFEQALAIHKQALGEKHRDTSTSLNLLAMLYHSQGDYARAAPLLEQALAIHKRALGENHPDYAMTLNNLAALYYAQGDYARALPLYERALAINKQALGENHPDTAPSLDNLAMLYGSQGDYAPALPLFEQALEIRKRALGENHPDTAMSLNNLAVLYYSQGDYARALPLVEQALEIRKQALGENHPDTAASLNNLAWLYQSQGDYARALPLFEQALAIHKQALGENHPLTVNSLDGLAAHYEFQGDYARALPLFQRAGEIIIGHLDATASIQSERQQLAHSNKYKGYVSRVVSCSLLAGRLEKNAYQQVMARKGAVLRRQRQLQMAREADDPNEQRLWSDFHSVTTRLATISLNAPGPDQAATRRRQLADLTEQKERLEAQLSQRSLEFRQLQTQVRLTPDELRAILPEDVTLVDLLEFSRLVVEKQRVGPPKQHFEWRLAAFVLRADSPVVAIDLGLAEPINAAVAAWREHFGDFSDDENDAGQQLRRLVWAPLASHLEGATTVLISPDGALASIPWGALPGSEPDTYLLEERAIAVVPVPQLISEMLQEADDALPSLFVVGDVDYGAAPGQPVLVAQSRSAPRSVNDRDRLGGLWSALSATGSEITGIEKSFRKVFPPAEVTELRAASATEEAFRQQAGKHRFLHLATHGFFAPPEIQSALAQDKSRDSAMGHSDLFGERGVVGFHPGLLSGIVLAGANLSPAPERDDGILTALEVGALDLRNVDLVTLSACETGLGQVAGGEGILGLQRAFQIAGARTTVASLWKVNDDATRALMTEFYRNLWEKKLSRIEALRRAQLAMLDRYDPKSHTLRGPGGTVAIDPEKLAQSRRKGANAKTKRTPPAYWAAFVLSGDWR